MPTVSTPFCSKPDRRFCFIDLRAKEARDLLDQVQKEWPEVLIMALGTPRSEPLREAEQSGIYAAEDLQLDRRRFQALVHARLSIICGSCRKTANCVSNRSFRAAANRRTPGAMVQSGVRPFDASASFSARLSPFR